MEDNLEKIRANIEKAIKNNSSLLKHENKKKKSENMSPEQIKEDLKKGIECCENGDKKKAKELLTPITRQSDDKVPRDKAIFYLINISKDEIEFFTLLSKAATNRFRDQPQQDGAIGKAIMEAIRPPPDIKLMDCLGLQPGLCCTYQEEYVNLMLEHEKDEKSFKKYNDLFEKNIAKRYDDCIRGNPKSNNFFEQFFNSIQRPDH